MSNTVPGMTEIVTNSYFLIQGWTSLFGSEFAPDNLPRKLLDRKVAAV
jgi:hypothetical protein